VIPYTLFFYQKVQEKRAALAAPKGKNEKI